MKKFAPLALLVAVLSGCSGASGLTYSASSVSVPGHEHAYRVSCGGVFGGPKSCQKAAARICGDRQITPLETTRPYQSKGGESSPDSLTFECADPASSASSDLNP
jgi:OmpA-OmpF porin, OOP family